LKLGKRILKGRGEKKEKNAKEVISSPKGGKGQSDWDKKKDA